jgi:hypothetical protein
MLSIQPQALMPLRLRCFNQTALQSLTSPVSTNFIVSPTHCSAIHAAQLRLQVSPWDPLRP